MKTIQERLDGINELILNSSRSYNERYAEEVTAEAKRNVQLMKEGINPNDEFKLDETLEYDFSSYIPQANITRHELDFEGRQQFQIGNNLPSAE